MKPTKLPLRAWKAVIHHTLAEAKEDSTFSWLGGEKAAAPFLPLGTVWMDTGSGFIGLPGHVETTAANAHLIAAAPDLYEALSEALLRCTTSDNMRAQMIAALAKARGES